MLSGVVANAVPSVIWSDAEHSDDSWLPECPVLPHNDCKSIDQPVGFVGKSGFRSRFAEKALRPRGSYSVRVLAARRDRAVERGYLEPSRVGLVSIAIPVRIVNETKAVAKRMAATVVPALLLKQLGTVVWFLKWRLLLTSLRLVVPI